jgi:hypothetical protein
MRLWLALPIAIAVVTPAYAGSESCWSSLSDTPASAGFVCIKLTEQLLRSLRNALLQDVERAMGVPGRVGSAGRLHFISNYSEEGGSGSGEVAFSFGPDGQVVDIDATVSAGPATSQIVFVWTADGARCSDFPGSNWSRCDQ